MESSETVDDPIDVGIAEYAVSDNGKSLSTYGLGSCVAVALYDTDNGVSGLAHVMLPNSHGNPGDEPGKFADTAVTAMLAEMRDQGATPANVRAKILGGSEMFEFTGIAEGVGQRNVQAVRDTLETFGIPIDAEDVGGDHGRTVILDGVTGTITLKTASDEVTEL